MSIRIGLYEFFAYTIPGVFHLLIITYGLTIFGFITVDLKVLNGLSLYSFLVLIGAGYIMGLLLDPIAYKWVRLFQKRNREARKVAFDEFHSRYPWMELNFKSTDWSILFQIIKSNSMETAMDIEQQNVVNIMLRNVSFSLVAVSALYVLFFFIVSNNIWNLVLAGVSFLLSMIAINRSKVRRHWFYTAIFETFVTQHLPQVKWIGYKPDVIHKDHQNATREDDVLPSKSDAEAQSAESD